MIARRLSRRLMRGPMIAVVVVAVALALPGNALAVPALYVNAATMGAVEGEAFNGTLATFVDAGAVGGADVASNYSATIGWGDGTTTPGTVTIGGGTYAISGLHTYAAAGRYSVSVTLNDSDGSSGSEASTQTVADAPLSAVVHAGTAFSGSGSTAATSLAAFEAAIGGTDNGVASGEHASGYRAIKWDDVTLDGSDPGSTVIAAHHVVALAATRMQPRGVELQSPVAVAGDGFASVNAGVSGLFAPASAPNVFAPFGSDSVALDIVAPAGQASVPLPAATRGFGVEFLNVKVPNATSIAYYSGDALIATVFAPVGSKAFVGELFDAPVVTHVVLTLGTGAIFSFNGSSAFPGVTVDSAPDNLVAGDDVALAEPAPSGATLSAVVGTPFSGTLGGFQDPDPSATAALYGATVDWGDGNESVGQVAGTAAAGFTVSGGHTYAQAGTYEVATTVRDLGGASYTIGSVVAVAGLPPATSTTTTTSSTVTATASPGGCGCAPNPPFPVAARCSLKLGSTTLAGLRVVPVAASAKATAPGPAVAVTCNESASVTLAATATLRRKGSGKRPPPPAKTLAFATATASVSAGAARTLVLTPAAATLARLRAAAARHDTIALALTLTATTSAGQHTTVTATAPLTRKR